MAGDKLASLFTGKSYSEKKMEQEEQLAQQQQQGYPTTFDTGSTNPFSAYQPTLTPQQLMAMQQALYGGGGSLNDDFMYMTMMNRRV